MALLTDMFRTEVSKSKDLSMAAEATPDIGYNTGYANFDFLNGHFYDINNDEKNIHKRVLVTGITDGSFNMIIGRTGCGKSTFTEQIAANIVRPFKTSTIFIDSTESMSMTWDRRESISGLHGDELKNRYIVRDSGISAENFYKRIKMIYNMKMSNKEKFMYDTGRIDSFGNKIYKFEPTVYILDSIPLLEPENEFERDELGGNMTTTAAAKVITQIFRGIIQPLKAANIILFGINHILSAVQIGPFPSKPDLAYLKPGETLPRGRTVSYLANTVIRLDDATKLKSSEKYKVDGSLVTVSLVKTRSTFSNKHTQLVLNFATGFDPIISALVFMQNTDRIHGAGIGLYLDDHTDMKFSMGNFKTKLKENVEFAKAFTKAYTEELLKLPTPPPDNTIFDMNMKLNSAIMGNMKLE